MKNTKQIQIIVVAVVVLIMGFLVLRPVKGLVDQEKNTAGAATTEAPANQITLSAASEAAKRGLNPAILNEITDLEAKADKADGDEKVAIYQQLADKWNDLEKFAPQALLYEEMAKISPKFDLWLKAGNAYRKAYTNLQDTTTAKALNQQAIAAYEKAVELNGASLDAKTGLGAAMVTGTNNPMAGIALLQEVVKAEPKNLEANKTLGLFSLQSRQFDKAIERFKTVIEQRPDAESYFYLATGYENIGMKNEAIAAFQKSKGLAADPSLSQFIDRRIDELSK
ncbi:tetratricopeptide repeat protein [Sphingobacterium hotanense]|uniref:tetratricopeptide repeat protein n=1 Tax=Sphingobacterium hotanense TaxID=649196 RepID=UPI0011F1D2D0|nr:tetratricopeptide repeat protein [Sphingobacterium hotanense]